MHEVLQAAAGLDGSRALGAVRRKVFRAARTPRLLRRKWAKTGRAAAEAAPRHLFAVEREGGRHSGRATEPALVPCLSLCGEHASADRRAARQGTRERPSPKVNRLMAIETLGRPAAPPRPAAAAGSRCTRVSRCSRTSFRKDSSACGGKGGGAATVRAGALGHCCAVLCCAELSCGVVW